MVATFFNGRYIFLNGRNNFFQNICNNQHIATSRVTIATIHLKGCNTATNKGQPSTNTTKISGTNLATL